MRPSRFNQLNARAEAHSSKVQANIDQVLSPVADAVNRTPMGAGSLPTWIRPNPGAGWANLGGTTAKLAYHKDALGYVHVKGTLNNTSGALNGGTIFTLPLGFRSAEAHSFAARGDVFYALNVTPSGVVSVPGGVAIGGFVSTEFSFLADA